MVPKSVIESTWKFPDYRKCVLSRLHYSPLVLRIGKLLEYTNVGANGPLDILLLLSADIETNPGPQMDRYFKFLHWNLNSICARGGVKIQLLEAYNSVYRFDVMALSETMLNSTVFNRDNEIEGFRKEIYRNYHPNDTKTGDVCL